MMLKIKKTRVSNLVKKTLCNTKITETERKINDHNHDKYITTPEFTKFTTEIFRLRLKQENFASRN